MRPIFADPAARGLGRCVRDDVQVADDRWDEISAAATAPAHCLFRRAGLHGASWMWRIDGERARHVCGGGARGPWFEGTRVPGDAVFVRENAPAGIAGRAVVSVPVRAWARRRGRGLEDAARELRYAALARLARRFRCAAVATAHTLDDQVETVFLNLLRGTGPGGLAAMAEHGPGPFP
jgi:hypothetical protein